MTKFESYHRGSEEYFLKNKCSNMIISENLTKLQYTAYKAAFIKFELRGMWIRNNEIIQDKDDLVHKATFQDIKQLKENSK